MLPQVRDIRRQGSCALDLCAVAAGQLDAYVEEGPHIWDHAAGGLIATEAGARVEVWTTAAAMDARRVPLPTHGWSAFSDLVRDCGFLGRRVHALRFAIFRAGTRGGSGNNRRTGVRSRVV